MNDKIYREFIPGEVPKRDMHQILLSGVAPRPIALVSTFSKDGVRNLAPYSFYNSFASNPPIIAIGPAIGAATGKIKDTYTNIMETGECTINAVTYSMTEQISLASCEYEEHIDEFEKCGLHAVSSTLVKPERVLESPFHMECVLMEAIALRRDIAGNGNIILLEVKKVHAAEDMFTDNQLDPQKLDLVARMGYDFYCRAHGEAVFEVHKPKWNGIGFDNLPRIALGSKILTGSDLAKLAGVKNAPIIGLEDRKSALKICLQLNLLSEMPDIGLFFDSENIDLRHGIVSKLLNGGFVQEAWALL